MVGYIFHLNRTTCRVLVADPRGQFGATASLNLCGWRTFAIIAHLFGAHGSRNRLNNTLKKTIFFAKLNIRIYVLDFNQFFIE